MQLASQLVHGANKKLEHILPRFKDWVLGCEEVFVLQVSEVLHTELEEAALVWHVPLVQPRLRAGSLTSALPSKYTAQITRPPRTFFLIRSVIFHCYEERWTDSPLPGLTVVIKLLWG